MEQLSQLKRPAQTGQQKLSSGVTAGLIAHYRGASERLILLDYDGVLAEMVPDISPAASQPSPKLLRDLTKLHQTPGTEIMIVSGRPRFALEAWFAGLSIGLAAEHGAWTRGRSDWRLEYELATDWKTPFRAIIEQATTVTPGSSVEHKDFALVWHYRSVAPVLAASREIDLFKQLTKLAAGSDIGVFRGHKIIEIKPRVISKGAVVTQKLAETPRDFMLAIGDDYNDEAMFSALPPEAATFKVGGGATKAKFRLQTVSQVHDLIATLAAAL